MRRPFHAVVAVCLLSGLACRVDDPSAVEVGEDGQVVPAANAAEADDYILDLAGATAISLSGSAVTVSGQGVVVDGTTARITRAGTYRVQGRLADGQVEVDAEATDKVKLILAGVDITTSDDAPILVRNASKAVLYLQPGTVNTLTDGAASTRDGAIHCKTRLSIFGSGTLNVTGRVDDGINSQGGIVIEGGTYDVRSLESGIKSDINVVVNGGTFTIRAGNDGIHGEESLTINGGDVTVAQSVEGIEAAAITMTGGTVHITSSDDGVNASSGNGGGPGGAPPGMETGSNTFTMRGGDLYANANGDGLDINGPIAMSGGTLVVDGPTANDNGALDYTGSFQLSGGYLLAVGSAGMAQAPSTSSSQNSVAIRFSSTQQAGVLVHVADPGGGDVLTFRPAKRYQSVVLSSPLLVRGSGYSVWVGGSSTGTERDGVFSGGTHLGGTRRATFDVAGPLTVVNAS